MSKLATNLVGSAADPIANFGRGAAAIIVSTVKRLPAPKRKPALKAWLDAIDPTLNEQTFVRALKVQVQTVDALDSLKKGLSIALANQMMHAIIEAGEGSTDKLEGLGCDCGGRKSAMGGLWDEVKDISLHPGIVGGVRAVQKLACATVNNPAAVRIARASGAKASLYMNGNPSAFIAAAGRGVPALAKACSTGDYVATSGILDVAKDVWDATGGKVVGAVGDLGEAAYEAAIKPALSPILNQLKGMGCDKLISQRPVIVTAARAAAAGAIASVGIPPNPITDKIVDKLVNAAIGAAISAAKCPTVQAPAPTAPVVGRVLGTRITSSAGLATAQLIEEPKKSLLPLAIGAGAVAALFLL